VVDSRLMPEKIFDLQALSPLKEKLIFLYVNRIIDDETYNRIDRISDVTKLSEELRPYEHHFFKRQSN